MRRSLILAPMFLLLTGPGTLPGEISPDSKQNIRNLYLNKACFLRIPLTGAETRISLSASGYRLLSTPGKMPVLALGEQVRITDVDFGNREFRFKITAISRPQAAEIKFSFTGLADEAALEGKWETTLGKFFTPGIRASDVDDARKEYLQDEYLHFVENQAFLSGASAAAIHDSVLQANPPGRDLREANQRLEARLQSQAASLSTLEKEKASLSTRLQNLQQEKQATESTGKDYREQIKSLQAGETEIKRQLTRKTQELSALFQAVQAAAIELGLPVGSQAPPAEMIQSISRQVLQISAANRTYQARVDELNGKIIQRENELATLNSRLEQSAKERDTISRQLSLLTSKDQVLAKQLLQLQHESNIVQSKLLSRNLLHFQVKRERQKTIQSYRADITLNSIAIGSILLSAPYELNPAQPNRISLEMRMKAPAALQALHEPELDLLLKYLERFPQLTVTAAPANPGFELKLAQSPDKDNTTVWIWEIKLQGRQDADINFRFSSLIESEPLPLFDLPVSIPFPSMERTIMNYFQPVPAGVGIVLGLLLALPFFIIQRARHRKHETGREGHIRKSLHFDRKEL